MSRVCNRVILLAYAAWDAAILFWDEKERHLSRALELAKEAEALFFDFEKPHGLSRAEKPLKAGNEGGCSGDPRRINSLRITVMNSS